MGTVMYDIDIETPQELDINTLYFENESNSLVLKEWSETNIFLLFKRMENSYKEIVKYLEIHNEPRDPDEPIVIGQNTENSYPNDYSYLIGEMKERIEDCKYYIDNLVESCQKDGFGNFVMGELTKNESHINTIIEIENNR
ncbi:MAG: hypothetical protein U9Q33_07320 [Campylobacterota bacterium]|nr:hypothetical protein [Campylobacterota bacterium]